MKFNILSSFKTISKLCIEGIHLNMINATCNSPTGKMIQNEESKIALSLGSTSGQ